MVVAKPVDVVWGRGSGKVQCCDWDKTPPRVDVWDDGIWKPGDETVKLEWMTVAVGRFGARLGSDISISVSSWTSSSPIKVESKGSPPFSLFHLKPMYQNEALLGHLLTMYLYSTRVFWVSRQTKIVYWNPTDGVVSASSLVLQMKCSTAVERKSAICWIS